MNNKISTVWIYEDGPLVFSTERKSGETDEEWLSRHFAMLSVIFLSFPPDEGKNVTTSWGSLNGPQDVEDEVGESVAAFLVEHEANAFVLLGEEPPL